jgi:hypothetical protein
VDGQRVILGEGLERSGSRNRGDETEVLSLLCVSVFPSAPEEELAKWSICFSSRYLLKRK